MYSKCLLQRQLRASHQLCWPNHFNHSSFNRRIFKRRHKWPYRPSPFCFWRLFKLFIKGSRIAHPVKLNFTEQGSQVSYNSFKRIYVEREHNTDWGFHICENIGRQIIYFINLMPRKKFFCEYCGIFLTHSSLGGRKQHARGKKHIKNKIDYYS